MVKRVLIIAQDTNLLTFLRLGLEREGLTIYTDLQGREGLRQTYELRPHLILLDLDSIQDTATYQRLKHLCDTPILMLLSKTAWHQLPIDLHQDYPEMLEKPFNLENLKNRVHILLEKTPSNEDKSLIIYDDGHLQINLEEQIIKRAGKLIDLTPTETRLLFYLIGQRGRIVPHKELLMSIWGPEYIDELGYLSVYIRYLRKKIEKDPDNPNYICTRWGVGYYFSGARGS